MDPKSHQKGGFASGVAGRSPREGEAMSETIIQEFFQKVHARGAGHPALKEKRDGRWEEWSWADYGEQVSRTAEGLRAIGVESGDRVAILGANAPEWLFADIAAMCLGGAGAGIYPTDLANKVRYVVEHCKAKVLVVDTPEQLAKTDGWRDELEILETVVITRPGSSELPGGKVISWDDLLAKGTDAFDKAPDAVEKEALAVSPDALAMLVYTSGTTGPPKGAMYSHASLLYESKILWDVLGGDDYTTISFLPLCHIAERLQGETVAILGGGTVWFAESVDKLKDNLAEVRPTVLLCVPRVWEKFYAAISAKFDEATGLKKKLVDGVLTLGPQVAHLRNRGEPLPFWLSLRWSVLSKLVVAKLKATLGLDRVGVFVSGAAPLSQKIAEFFGALEIDIHEVYGQTECVGVCTINPRRRIRFGTVGKPQDDCEVKIAADGEILVKGPNVFMGYLGDEAATKETVVDGWLHTGDVGEFTDEGYLRITDRKKDIIVTAGGKNIAPQNIENVLKTFPGISQVVVIGDKKKYLVALFTLDPTATDKLCAVVGIPSAPPEKLAEDPKILEKIQSYIDEFNGGEARYAQIKKFTILPRELSIEDDEITPTLKIKRRIVQKNHGATIDVMYPSE